MGWLIRDENNSNLLPGISCPDYGEQTELFSVNRFSPEDAIPESGYTCIGIVGIKDHVRHGVPESVALCRMADVTVRMVTGDNITTANAIAKECGILTDDGIAIEGSVFREKSLEELFELIPKIQVMTRSSPMDKHTLVRHLRTTFNEVVTVTGDETNDASALNEADIGFAMGIAGTEVGRRRKYRAATKFGNGSATKMTNGIRSLRENEENHIQIKWTDILDHSITF